jgi:hypothetical protein
LAEGWHESDAGVTSYAECQPGNPNVEDRAVDIEQEYGKTGKEEEKGNVD